MTQITEKPRDDHGRFVSPRSIPRYQITVWNMIDGDIVEKLWEASDNDLDRISNRYEDEPTYSIQVEDL